MSVYVILVTVVCLFHKAPESHKLTQRHAVSCRHEEALQRFDRSVPALYKVSLTRTRAIISLHPVDMTSTYPQCPAMPSRLKEMTEHRLLYRLCALPEMRVADLAPRSPAIKFRLESVSLRPNSFKQ